MFCRRSAESGKNAEFLRTPKQLATPCHTGFMRLHILSDLHLEFAPFSPPETDADVVVLAGDIHVGANGLKWAIENFPNTPVLYVLGNHEYYGQGFPRHSDKLRRQAKGTNVTVLECDEVEIGDVVFMGCTLWTDYRLKGDPTKAGTKAEKRMADFRQIRVSPGLRKLKFQDTARRHQQSLHWLFERVEAHVDRKKVIISHHAPSPQSIPERHAGSSIGAAYASDLEPFLEENDVSMWVHGHIHDPQDYAVGPTRIIANPRGYPEESNSSFNAGYIVEV